MVSLLLGVRHGNGGERRIPALPRGRRGRSARRSGLEQQGRTRARGRRPARGTGVQRGRDVVPLRMDQLSPARQRLGRLSQPCPRSISAGGRPARDPLRRVSFVPPQQGTRRLLRCRRAAQWHGGAGQIVCGHVSDGKRAACGNVRPQPHRGGDRTAAVGFLCGSDALGRRDDLPRPPEAAERRAVSLHRERIGGVQRQGGGCGRDHIFAHRGGGRALHRSLSQRKRVPLLAHGTHGQLYARACRLGGRGTFGRSL